MKPEEPAINKSPGQNDESGSSRNFLPEMKGDGIGKQENTTLPLKSSASPSPSFYEAAFYWILSR